MRTVEANEFLQLALTVPVADVRSPGEFATGHIAGAVNIALFSDAERAEVGTLYKQQGRDRAVNKGLEVVGPKMAALASQAKEVAQQGQLLVHCWRGGMRSNSMAWLFEQAGINCTVLKGGYKAYRNFILAEFSKANNLVVIDGPTGSGKTEILHHLRELGQQVIDLEAMAVHRGSAFGGFGLGEQPSTQQFQNNLFHQLAQFDPLRPVWVEAESLTIGKVYLPYPFWEKMNLSPTIVLNVPRHQRAQRLVADYGNIPHELLAHGIRKITDQFGGNRVKLALEMLEANNLYGVAMLLLEYYDERYAYGQQKNGRQVWAELTVPNVESKAIAQQLVLMNNHGTNS